MVAFRCYGTTRADGAHRDRWRAALPPEFNGNVDAELELRQLDRVLEEPYFKDLEHRCEGLIEIRKEFWLGPEDPRLRHERTLPNGRLRRLKVVIRVLGFGSATDFVLLWAFRKRGGPDYGPACRSALIRKAGVERDGKRARPCRFP